MELQLLATTSGQLCRCDDRLACQIEGRGDSAQGSSSDNPIVSILQDLACLRVRYVKELMTRGGMEPMSGQSMRYEDAGGRLSLLLRNFETVAAGLTMDYEKMYDNLNIDFVMQIMSRAGADP